MKSARNVGGPCVWVELCPNHNRTWKFESPWYTARNWSQEAFRGWACAEKEEQEPVYEFLIAAITKYHSRGGLKQHECIVTVGSWGQKSKMGLTRLKSKCGQRCVVSRNFRVAVPNLFGTRDQFHGRQSFHGMGFEVGVWLQDDTSTLPWLCTYLCVYYISSTSHHQALDPRGWRPLL